MPAIRTLSLICLIIACYYFTYYLYVGIQNPIPALGDSWDYHIPISKSIIDGQFLQPHFTQVKQYFPGSSEAINSILILLHIPLTISNILAIFILTICCYKLATTFRLQRYYALLFALTFVTTTAVMRWMNAVSIDVWLAIYFTIIIMLLEKPKKSTFYFLQLGFFTGMLIGSKYNAIYYLIILVPFYFKRIIPYINVQRIILFFIPFSIFGLFWYVRNYIAVHNPVYPITLFGMPGIKGYGGFTSFNYSMLYIGITHPSVMIDSAFGEYKIWILSIFVICGALIHQFFVKKNYKIDTNAKIFLIGILSFILFLSFPTDSQPWIMVSSFRYSYPTFIILLLGVFILGSQYKKETYVGYIAIACMINVLTMVFYPKLLIVYLPLALLIFYLFERGNKRSPLNVRKLYTKKKAS